MFTGSSQAGSRRRSISVPLRIGIGAALALLTACAAPPQGGSPGEAADAATEFLETLVAEDAAAAWARLTPPTRSELYANEEATFAQEVTSADWSELSWQIRPVTDYEISWGVHVSVDQGASVPDFLISRGLAGGWEGSGFILLVQIPREGDYWIAGQGLDTRLHP